MTPRRSSAQPGSVRIIAGQWRRSLLPVPDRPDLRPTPDRVRETVFNWLVTWMPVPMAAARVLDPFAGSGALGFEAASRGAASVTLLDHDPQVVSALSTTKARLDATAVTVLRADAASWLAQRAGEPQAMPYELIFLDPPFSEHRLPSMVVLTVPHLADGGCLYLESDEPIAGAFETHLQAHGLELVRSDRAGQVYFGLARLRR